MPRLIFAENPVDPLSWTAVETADVAAALKTRYPVWPAEARIYDVEGIDASRLAGVPLELGRRDVTPTDETSADHLLTLRGPLLVSVPPGDPLTIIAIAVAVLSLAVAVVSLLIKPKLPSLNNQQTTSPNNALSQRSNQARPAARIPDIYGEVVSTPDLLAVPYSMFINNLEVEIAYMCIGRGSFDITDVSDGATRIAAIAGAGVEVYGPNTSPNSGGPPQLRIGTPIATKVLSVAKANDVNGQTLRAPNSNSYRASGNVRFVAPDTIQANNGTGAPAVDFTTLFGEGDQLTVQNATFGGGATYLNASTQDCRFYPDYRIEFSSFDPRTLYASGQNLVVSNAGFAGQDSTGKVVYVDVSGTYVIDSMTATTIQLEVPTP